MKHVRILLDTQTGTYAPGESTDNDPDTAVSDVPAVDAEWTPGDRRPLLFGGATEATGDAPMLAYDPQLEMSVDGDGRPLIAMLRSA